VGEFWEVMEELDGSFTLEPHMEASVVVVPKPAVKGFFQILPCVIALEPVEFFLIGLM